MALNTPPFAGLAINPCAADQRCEKADCGQPALCFVHASVAGTNWRVRVCALCFPLLWNELTEVIEQTITETFTQ